MRRYLLAAVSVLVVSNSLAAQESLWSGTMTAGKDEINGNRVVGYNRSPAAPVMGELSDAEFDFRGITYRTPHHLARPSLPLGACLPRARSTATVNPLRGSSAPLRPFG